MNNIVELDAPVAMRWPKRLLAFYGVAALFVLLFAGMLTFMVPVLPLAFTGWFDAAGLGAHQIHDTLAAVLLWAALVGVLAQFLRPRTQTGGMQQSLAVLVALNGAIVAGRFSFAPMLIFLGLAVMTATLHPAGRHLLPRPGRASYPLLAMTLLIALPVLLYASGQIGLQRLAIPDDPHGEFGHWVIMGGYALAIVFLSGLAGLRPTGWRVPAWSAGLLAILLGLASLVLDGASALSPLWSVIAIAWGGTYITLVEKVRRLEA